MVYFLGNLARSSITVSHLCYGGGQGLAAGPDHGQNSVVLVHREQARHSVVLLFIFGEVNIGLGRHSHISVMLPNAISTEASEISVGRRVGVLH